MLKRQAVNQATACVRTAHTLHVGFEVPRNSQVRVCGAATHALGWICRLRLAENVVSGWFLEFQTYRLFGNKVS